ncbi:MAG: metallophosphoesterase family protein [Elusimicrobiota bacterium]
MSYVGCAPSIEKLNTTYQKVGLLGGVYNNHVALQKACEMATHHGMEKIFQLGDLGGFGPYPNEVFPILKQFNVQCIQGNYEESLITQAADCGCGYSHPKDNYYAAMSYDYTDKNISDENRSLLKNFPKQVQFHLGSFVVHLCHGSPRRINEFLWDTTTSNAFLLRMMDELECDILCCTHTGIPWKREVAPRKWVVNIGAIGRPANDGNQNVWYSEISILNNVPQIELLKVDYDWSVLAQEMRDEKLPQEFIDTITTGWWTTCLEILPGKERLRGRF